MKRSIETISELLVSVACALPVFIAFRDCVADVCLVSGVSMQPTLNPVPDRATLDKYFFSRYLRDIVLLERMSIRSGSYERGSVVLLKSVEDPNKYLLKRLVGVDSDWITAAREEKYVHIQKGFCWVEGDNRNHSIDSNDYGPVPLGMIVGKVTHVIWPPWRICAVPSLSPSQVDKLQPPVDKKSISAKTNHNEPDHFIEVKPSRDTDVESILSNLDLSEQEKTKILKTIQKIREEQRNHAVTSSFDNEEEAIDHSIEGPHEK